MRHVRIWTLSNILMSSQFLTACVSTSSDGVVVPPVTAYSPAFQDRLADEFNALPPACGPDTVLDGCSAARRAIMDYKLMRDQVRAVD